MSGVSTSVLRARRTMPSGGDEAGGVAGVVVDCVVGGAIDLDEDATGLRSMLESREDDGPATAFGLWFWFRVDVVYLVNWRKNACTGAGVCCGSPDSWNDISLSATAEDGVKERIP